MRIIWPGAIYILAKQKFMAIWGDLKHLKVKKMTAGNPYLIQQGQLQTDMTELIY